MRNKVEITQAILDQIPAAHNYKVEDVMSLWWVNIRSTGGLRLTSLGYTVLSGLKLESWEVEIDPKKFDREMVLLLDRKLQAPYFIETNKKIPHKIVMFSSKEAMLAQLYGDLKTFLKQLP